MQNRERFGLFGSIADYAPTHPADRRNRALGPHLAAELLAAGAAQRMAILLRPSASPLDAQVDERFERWLKVVASLLPATSAHGSALAAWRGELSSLHAVAGDIRTEALGLSPSDDELLRRETEVVIHAAADTGFSSSPAGQWDANVEGTRRMLQWAGRCTRLRKFILVSSTYVAGSRTGRIQETASPDRPEFVTHYQRTKWEAEQLALASGLPVCLVRVSLVMGSHATGFVHRTGALHNIIRWFGRGLIPMLPGLPDATADLIAAETAARVLTRAAIANFPAGEPRIWHIAAGRHAPPMREVVDFVYEQFASQPAWRRKGIPKPPLVGQGEFDGFCQSAETLGHPALSQALRSINSFLPDLLHPKIYETSRAEAMWGGPLPLPDWRATLERVIRFCCMRNGGKERAWHRPTMAAAGADAMEL